MILYLGLRAKKGVFHYPVIRTEKLPFSLPKHWDEFTHVIFTSQTTVEYWPSSWEKPMIAIGDATKRRILDFAPNADILMAKEATQEGIMEVLSHIPNGKFFLPHSKNARLDLIRYMQEKQIAYEAAVLYETVYQKIEPAPDLSLFDEIVFTSPSTVEGFLRIYLALPTDKKLTCIGPITERALKAHLPG